MKMIKMKMTTCTRKIFIGKFQEHINIFTLRQIILWLAILMASTTAGVIFGFTSFLFPQLQNSNFILNTSQQSWIASITSLVEFPTCILSGWAIQYLGRRTMALTANISCIAGWLTIYFSESYETMVLGRAIQGIFPGMGYPCFVSYLGEVIMPNLRPIFLTAPPMGITIGIFLGQTIGAVVDWRTLSLAICVVPAINICTHFFLRESYVWYLNRNEMEKARESFEWYRGNDEISNLEFKQTSDDNKSQEQRTVTELFKLCTQKSFLVPFGITLLVFSTNEFTGTQAISYYTSNIIGIVSYNEDFIFYSNLVLNIIRVFGTVLSSYLIHRLSIRFVLISSSIALGFSLLLLALFLFLTEMFPENSTFPILAVVALICDVLFFSIGLGPLPTAVCGEMYPIATRALGGSLSASLSFLFLFIVVRFMPLMFEVLSPSLTFCIFGIFDLVGITLTYFFLPNTKNKTINEISQMY